MKSIDFWAGKPEQKALNLIATCRAQQLELLLGLHPFSGGLDVEAFCKSGDGAHNRCTIRTRRQISHK